MCCIGELRFGGQQLGISRFDIIPIHIHSHQHALVCGTYQFGPNTKNAGTGANSSSYFGACMNSCGELRVWRKCNHVDRAIKRVIRTIVTEVYFWTRQNRHRGYATVHILDILTHLHATYDMLKDEDIQAIGMALKAPINGKTYFEDFSAQIKDNQEAAATQNPYTTGQILSIAYTLVFKVVFYTLKKISGRARMHQKKHGPHSKIILIKQSRK